MEYQRVDKVIRYRGENWATATAACLQIFDDGDVGGVDEEGEQCI